MEMFFTTLAVISTYYFWFPATLGRDIARAVEMYRATKKRLQADSTKS